ncbi:MAG: hypothetical protein UT33_C0008G0064 [Candidatus Peregrinibacteria bacterium GW2011_GWC2_39_14]|nr:MAG: hypothetical protein US92_C0004G0064 [Candidatus Peregrinibacteria bacterium GW2011_GWA2_38_36]KKR06748.1 MAG: hypothetical protein UT33_C0008G0064 [Candidatus Peregrinibacteria bacterium GW2011_GWC2_39_14]
MRIIFSKALVKRENMENDIYNIAKIAYEYASNSPAESIELIKIYVTTKTGERKIAFFINTNKNDIFFLLYRSRDKAIADFKRQLMCYLGILKFSLRSNWFYIFEFDHDF